MRKLLITNGLKTRFCFFSIFFFTFILGAQAQEYTFGYNLKKGDSFTQTTVADIKITQEAMGQKTDMGNTMTSTLSYKVAEVENDLISMEMTYDRMKMGVETMGTKIEADSKLSAEKIATEKVTSEKSINEMLVSESMAEQKTARLASSFSGMAPMLKSITNIPITLVLNKQGKIKEVRGAEKLQQSIARQAKTDGGQDLITAQFSQQFNEEAVKSMAEQNEIGRAHV